MQSSLLQEFERRLPSLDPFAINVVHTGKDDPCSGLINIMSYDLLPKHFDILKMKRFGIIIAVGVLTFMYFLVVELNFLLVGQKSDSGSQS